MRSILLLLLLFLVGVPAAAAQTGAEPMARGEELRVFVMTMGPGREVWERFGHNAIRIRDELRGTDVAYNYGMFSFDQEDFLLRFARGQMDYWMEGFDTFAMASFYIQQDRSVWVQELNLEPALRADLRDFLEWNARPENTVYRYDYYRDNCSTRVRDALDRVLGGQIEAQTAQLRAHTTYREHTRQLTGQDLLVYSGTMVGLGAPVDREISVWEEMFLPLEFRDHLRELTIRNSAGEEVPLVLAEEEVHLSRGIPEGGAPPVRFPGYLAVGVLLGASFWAGARQARERRALRLGVMALGTGWSLLAGVLGIVLFGLWAFTDHAASARNENLLFFTPLHLPLAILLPAALWKGGRARTLGVQLAMLVAGVGVLGLALQLLPGFGQVNAELIALALPANLGLALGLRDLGRARTGPLSREGTDAPLDLHPSRR